MSHAEAKPWRGVARVGLLAVGVAACEATTPSEEGARLFASPALSTSRFNEVSCSTCHAVERGAPPVVPGRYDTGANLAGSVDRPSFWGGNELRLLDAINVCVEHFMRGAPLVEEDERAKRLFVFLAAASAGPQPVVPFTLVRNVTALTALRGDARRGAIVYDRACVRCHGAAGGPARLSSAPVIAEGVAAAANARAEVVEKVRHGKFFGLGGVMPLYSVEVMDDDALVDLLAHLGL